MRRTNRTRNKTSPSSSSTRRTNVYIAEETRARADFLMKKTSRNSFSNLVSWLVDKEHDRLTRPRRRLVVDHAPVGEPAPVKLNFPAGATLPEPHEPGPTPPALAGTSLSSVG